MSEGTSPWVYIGLGCLVAVILAVGSCVGIVWFGAKKMEQMVEELEDPEKRAERVAEVLGMDEVPEGYYPAMAFSVPFVMEMAILSDQPVTEHAAEGQGADVEATAGGETDDAGPGGTFDGFDQRGFVYINTKTFGNDLDKITAYLRGEETSREAFDNIKFGVSFDDDVEILVRGDFTTEQAEYVWAAHRGRIDTKDGDIPGLETLVYVDCGIDKRLRMGIWMGPDPDPEAAVDDLDLAGTNADPAEIEAFMSHFTVCP